MAENVPLRQITGVDSHRISLGSWLQSTTVRWMKEYLKVSQWVDICQKVGASSEPVHLVKWFCLTTPSSRIATAPCMALANSDSRDTLRRLCKDSHPSSDIIEEGPPKIQLREPQLQSNLVHFSFIRWDLVATVLIIFPIINWPNWQI